MAEVCTVIPAHHHTAVFTNISWLGAPYSYWYTVSAALAVRTKSWCTTTVMLLAQRPTPPMIHSRQLGSSLHNYGSACTSQAHIQPPRSQVSTAMYCYVQQLYALLCAAQVLWCGSTVLHFRGTLNSKRHYALPTCVYTCKELVIGAVQPEKTIVCAWNPGHCCGRRWLVRLNVLQGPRRQLRPVAAPLSTSSLLVKMIRLHVDPTPTSCQHILPVAERAGVYTAKLLPAEELYGMHCNKL